MKTLLLALASLAAFNVNAACTAFNGVDPPVVFDLQQSIHFPPLVLYTDEPGAVSVQCDGQELQYIRKYFDGIPINNDPRMTLQFWDGETAIFIIEQLQVRYR